MKRITPLFAPRPDWHTHAACRGLDPAIFHPERGEGTTAGAHAKTICAGCTVRPQCLEQALTTNENVGIWGGTSNRERRHLRRNHDRNPRRTP